LALLTAYRTVNEPIPREIMWAGWYVHDSPPLSLEAFFAIDIFVAISCQSRPNFAVT
jgi:hypothetical protein